MKKWVSELFRSIRYKNCNREIQKPQKALCERFHGGAGFNRNHASVEYGLGDWREGRISFQRVQV